MNVVENVKTLQAVAHLVFAGETIKKKYITILDMLKKERLTFGNQLEGLESQIEKQEEEIEKLKVRSHSKKFQHNLWDYKTPSLPSVIPLCPDPYALW